MVEANIDLNSFNFFQHCQTSETYDMIEKHLRSLKALGENVDQPHFVFLIKSKLPKTVISRMEEYKDVEEKWTVESIRKALKRYICAQEVGERQTQLIESPESQDTTVRSQKHKSSPSRWSGITTTDALLSGNKESATDGQTMGSFYCHRKDHWSDQCKTYPTVESRKAKIKRNCFICLKPNHLLKDCKVNKPCYVFIAIKLEIITGVFVLKGFLPMKKMKL